MLCFSADASQTNRGNIFSSYTWNHGLLLLLGITSLEGRNLLLSLVFYYRFHSYYLRAFLSKLQFLHLFIVWQTFNDTLFPGKSRFFPITKISWIDQKSKPDISRMACFVAADITTNLVKQLKVRRLQVVAIESYTNYVTFWGKRKRLTYSVKKLAQFSKYTKTRWEEWGM